MATQAEHEGAIEQARCLGCGYCLYGLDRRCPECGRRFDPRDRLSYAPPPDRRGALPASRPRRIAKWAGLVVCVVILWMWGEGMSGRFSYQFGVFGFGVEGGRLILQLAAIPLWLLLTLAAIPTAHLWLRDRRTVKPGCCQTCGYDLWPKKTCPECGTAVATGELRAGRGR